MAKNEKVAPDQTNVSTLKLEEWPIEKLTGYARNPRKNDHVVDRMVEAIKEFGFRIPVVAKSDGTVVDGHLRLKAAQKMKLTTVPVVLADELTDAQVKAFRILANKSVTWASWDDDLLKLEMEELKATNFNLELTGFSLDEINSAFNKTSINEPNEGKTNPDELPEPPKKNTVQTGEVWLLGPYFECEKCGTQSSYASKVDDKACQCSGKLNLKYKHRVLCGDSTKQENIDKLMSGAKADMVFTDPPYNIASHGKNHARKELRGDSYGKLSEAEWDKNFDINEALARIESALSNRYSIYVCTSHFLLPDILNWMKRFNYHNVCVWDKPNPMPSLSKRYWCWSHEFIAYATSENHVFNYPEKGNAKSVWSLAKIVKAEFHPTQKPVAVPEHAILHSSEPGSLVLDIFGGSGSTLIACEKTGRRCYIAEMQEKYCDTIISRFVQFSGLPAIRELDQKLWVSAVEK